MIQVHAYFSGMVQGVGFRYTVQRYATDLGLAGWVRNLPDGRVEMKAVGPRDALEDLVRRVDAHFDGYVSDTQVWWEDHPEQFTDFKITF